MDVLSSHLITLPADHALLERFYNELMIPNFPLKEELEPLPRWVEALEENLSNKLTGTGCYLNILVCFDHKDVERKTLIGGIVFEYYYPSNTALITYLVTNPLVRGQGSGIFLGIQAWGVMKTLSKKYGFSTPHVIFCEVNDPMLVTESQDAYSPINRIRAFQQMGVRPLDNFKYVQPALQGREERGRDMMLAVVVGPMTPRSDSGESFVYAKDVVNFLKDFYTALNVKDVEQDADFKAMLSCIGTRDRLFLKDFDLSRFKASKKPAKIVAPPSGPRNGVHIVVVGSGLSGLACARQLIDAGFIVTILEGRNRIGGRIYTSRIHDTRFDYGAAWLHGMDGNPLSEWTMEQLPNLKFHKSNEQAIVLYDKNGKQIDQSLLFEIYLKHLQVLEALHADYNKQNIEDKEEYEKWKKTQPKVSESLQDALDRLFKKTPSLAYANEQEKVVMNFLMSQLESLQSASSADLNGRDYDHGITYEGGDNIIPSGFQNVTIMMSKGLDVQLDRTVTRIHWGATNSKNNLPQLKVDIKDHPSIECNGVVVTASIGVIQSPLISYAPALPRWKVDAINNVGAGLFNKCVMRFAKCFWDRSADYIGYNFPANAKDTPLSSFHSERSNSWFVNYEPVAKEPILIAMLSGDLAKQCEKWNDQQVVDEMMRRLRIMYGKDVERPLDAVVTRWGSDPFSLCSYSFMKKGGSIQDIEDIGKPIDNQIFFAGEHTSTNRFGYADGAFVSGQREAKRIMELYSHLTKLPSKL